jgi:glycosyltransferase involved in cell wall biosynthesis
MASNRASRQILLLSGFRIFPAFTGGHVHTGGVAHALAKMGHQVRIYSLAGRQSDYSFRKFFGEARRIDVIAPNLTEETNLGPLYGLLQALMRRLDIPRVWLHGLMRLGIVPRGLREALRNADVVICDLPWCAKVPGPWSSKPWYMLSHNLEYRLLEQAAPRQRRFAGWMRRVEQQAPTVFKDIFACAEEDRNFFRAQSPAGKQRIPLIRCGVDPDDYQVVPGTRERLRAELGLTEEDHLLVFSGSGYAPNVEALATVREFVRKHAEFLARARVYILALGSVAAAPSREGALITTGRVPAVIPYFAAADAGLNPVVRGSGSNVKVFEYLAARLPIISTAFGMRGTELQSPEDFLSYEGDTLMQAIATFVGSRTRQQWRDHAEAVWQRHSRSCDINELVKEAISQLPDFA